MAVAKLSAQDCKDLEKYLRYFVFKSAQIIVQSRLGERLCLPSKQFATGTDWFNLTVHDDADVLSEVKMIYPGPGGGLAGGDVVCFETLLRTSSGSVVPLETWAVKMVSPCDSLVRVSFTVYNRIGMLLKSLMIACRCVPAYQLSRRCCSMACDYSIYYRMYVGNPTLDLGRSFSNQTVGLVPTPVGTLHLSVAYRTQPLLTSNVAPAEDLELWDDHFCADRSSVSSAIPSSCWRAVSKWQQLADAQAQDSDVLSTSPPDHNRMVSIPSGLNQITKDVVCTRSDNTPRIAPFASSDTSKYFEFDADTALPFGQLLEHDMGKMEKNSEAKVAEKEIEMAARIQSVTLTNSGSTVLDDQTRSNSAPDNVPRSLKTPFASYTDACGKEEKEGDLGRFYRECQSAPALSMFRQPSADIHELLNSITDQLAQFEANAKEFDEFVNSFQET